METHDGQADEAEHHIEQDDGSAKVVFVSKPAGGVHDDGGKSVRRSNEALGSTGAEAHVEGQNDGQEVCQCVCDCGGIEKDLYPSANGE